MAEEATQAVIESIQGDVKMLLTQVETNQKAIKEVKMMLKDAKGVHEEAFYVQTCFGVPDNGRSRYRMVCYKRYRWTQRRIIWTHYLLGREGVSTTSLLFLYEARRTKMLVGS